MPKKLIKRFLPDHETIKNQKSLRIFGKFLYNPNLWCLNRRSASMAFAIGLFWAFIPLPTQMLCAAGCAIFIGGNLPLAIALVWLTNPLTMPFIFYGTYKFGTWILSSPNYPFHFKLSWEFLAAQMEHIGPPLFLGSGVCAIIAAILGYFLINYLWRYSVARNWQKRRLRTKRLIK